MNVLVVSHSDGSLMAQEIHSPREIAEWVEVLNLLCPPERVKQFSWKVVQETVREAA